VFFNPSIPSGGLGDGLRQATALQQHSNTASSSSSSSSSTNNQSNSIPPEFESVVTELIRLTHEKDVGGVRAYVQVLLDVITPSLLLDALKTMQRRLMESSTTTITTTTIASVVAVDDAEQEPRREGEGEVEVEESSSRVSFDNTSESDALIYDSDRGHNREEDEEEEDNLIARNTNATHEDPDCVSLIRVFRAMVGTGMVIVGGFNSWEETKKILSETEPTFWERDLKSLQAKATHLQFPDKSWDEVRAHFLAMANPLSEQDLDRFIELGKAMEQFFDSQYLREIKLEAITIQERLKAESASQVQSAPDEEEKKRRAIVVRLAFLRQCVYLTRGYYPYRTQILTIIALIHKQRKGRLAQVSTGQGKSIVVACLAATLALGGQRVDICTTSKMLAQRDAKEMAAFYSLIGLSTAHCCHEAPKYLTCYNVDVVYGTAFDFERAYLRDLFEFTNLRGPRPFDALIVDEVDSLFIDQLSNTTRLITSTKLFRCVAWCYGVILKEVIKNDALDTETALKVLQSNDLWRLTPPQSQSLIVNVLPRWVIMARTAMKSYAKNLNYIVKVCLTSLL